MGSRLVGISEQIDEAIRSSSKEDLLQLLTVLSDRAAIIRSRILEAPPARPRERALKVPRAARRLNCHDDTVRKLCKEQKLRHVLVGDEIRIPESAIEDFLRGGNGKAPGHKP